MVFIEDLKHYRSFCYPQSSLLIVFLRSIIAHPAIVAVLWYRFGNWSFKTYPAFKQLALFFYWIGFPLVRMMTGVQLLPHTKVGPGLVLLHYGTTVINPGAIIGSQCVLYQEVLIASDNQHQCPTIEDRVLIGAKASIIGPVIVGSDSAIGISAVVTRNIAPFSIAAGVPARTIRSRCES